jgi:predicted DNA-binding protein YlxM (UPF0122 family)
MLRARSEAIADAIRKTEKQIQTIEHTYTMLEGYSYEVEVLAPLEEVDAVEPQRGEAAE